VTGQLPALGVLAVLAVGLAVTTLVDWRAGTLLVGLAVLLAAALRLTLPAPQAGWLAVRSRAVDAAVLLTLGFAVVALAGTVPDA
jgi:hypothetical protein